MASTDWSARLLLLTAARLQAPEDSKPAVASSAQTSASLPKVTGALARSIVCAAKVGEGRHCLRCNNFPPRLTCYGAPASKGMLSGVSISSVAGTAVAAQALQNMRNWQRAPW